MEAVNEEVLEPKKGSQLVQMRLKPQTIDRVNHIRQLTGIENRSLIISSSIQLAEDILDSVKDGGKVYIENKNGEKYLLKFIL